MSKRFFSIFLIAIPFLLNTSFSVNKGKFKISKVVIDAGHGGKDPGCPSFSGKISEKDVALDIAMKVGKYIQEKFDDVEVIYTRKSDKFLELDKCLKKLQDHLINTMKQLIGHIVNIFKKTIFSIAYKF